MQNCDVFYEITELIMSTEINKDESLFAEAPTSEKCESNSIVSTNIANICGLSTTTEILPSFKASDVIIPTCYVSVNSPLSNIYVNIFTSMILHEYLFF